MTDTDTTASEDTTRTITDAAGLEWPSSNRRFRKKPVVIEATQWFKNGDHPLDGGQTDAVEGKIVRYFRRPDVPGSGVCTSCGSNMHDHGWIDTLEGGHIVCVGDWIITGVQGENYPCKPGIFAETYEPA